MQTSSTQVLARMGLLLAAWALVWSVTPQAMLASAWARFAWWTAMKGVVWIALGALLFQPESRGAWLGAYRGRIAVVLLLATTWVALDALAVRAGLKEAATLPTAREVTDRARGGRCLERLGERLVVAPILEELLFRGLFWSALERAKVRAVHVWALSAAAFAALHLPGWLATQAASPSL